MLKIGIDVDLVVAPSDKHWLINLQKVTGKTLNLIPTDYNLTNYFKEELDSLGLDGFEWWRGENIYDDIFPYEKSVEVINKWFNRGNEIVFISSIKGNHHKSKYNFLKRHFKFDAFIATKEKSFVDVDVMIDDRVDIITDFLTRRPFTRSILFPTVYNSGKVSDPNMIWKFIEEESEYNYDQY